MRLDNIPAVIYASRDWRLAAACRGVQKVEMVPGDEGAYASEGAEILAAKALCLFCPVKARCLRAADRSSGVWGGLTEVERERLRVNPEHRIVRCSKCDLDAVPWNTWVGKCDSCLSESEKQKSVEDFRDSIVSMVVDGYTYREAAERFAFRPETIRRACKRWHVSSKPGKRVIKGTSEEQDLAPCGTPARLRRHERDGDTDLKCACSQPGRAIASRTKANGWMV